MFDFPCDLDNFKLFVISLHAVARTFVYIQTCASTQMETTDHILWLCTFAQSYWTDIWAQFWSGGQTKNVCMMVQAWRKYRQLTTVPTQAIIWAAGTWALWRECNRRVFSGDVRAVHRLIHETVNQINQILRPGGCTSIEARHQSFVFLLQLCSQYDMALLDWV